MKEKTGKRLSLVQAVMLGFAGLLVASILAFVVYCLFPSPATPIGMAALSSDETVSVSQSAWLEFSPRQSASLSPATVGLDENSTTLPDIGESAATVNQTENSVDVPGFIFYPGMHIDYRAYAPLLREIAKAGFLVVVVPMPLNMAALNRDAALPVMAAYPAVKHWVVGGHSMGAVAASEFAGNFSGLKGEKDTAGKLAGLVLWGADSWADLSANGKMKVLSVTGDRDGNDPPALIEAHKYRLPPDSGFVVIKGGNHAQFACYGDQVGDNPATISAEEQRAQTIAATIQFLKSLEKSQ